MIRQLRAYSADAAEADLLNKAKLAAAAWTSNTTPLEDVWPECNEADEAKIEIPSGKEIITTWLEDEKKGDEELDVLLRSQVKYVYHVCVRVRVRVRVRVCMRVRVRVRMRVRVCVRVHVRVRVCVRVRVRVRVLQCV